MDDKVLRRLDCLSKKQLLEAIRVVTSGLGEDAPAVTSLKAYLDGIEPAPGSSRKLANSTMDSKATVTSSDPPKEPESGFDISKYRTRQVAFQVQYDGSKYLGFASQDLAETVENHLFNALIKLKLIEDRKTCRYSRCGRTDKGVSALGQVVSLCVRSAVPKDLPEELLQQLVHPLDKVVLPATTPATDASNTSAAAGAMATETDSSGQSAVAAAADSGSAKAKKGKAKAPAPAAPREKVIQEMDYVSMLNRALPDEIRVLGWTPVTDEFSARFSASHRTYRYFFLKKGLDVSAMQRAAQLLVGEHDFRNLSKLDIANVSNFRREVYYAKIVPFSMGLQDSGSEAHSDDADTVYMLEISGIAFLWHMVRAIMAVLLMVGEGLEQPSVVAQLLDITANPGKPPYSLADEQPLVLHECGFDRLVIPSQPRHLWQLTAHYRGIREAHLLAAARAQNSLEHVLSRKVRTGDAQEFEETLRQQEAKHAKSSGGGAKEGNNASSSASSGSNSGSSLHKRKLEALDGEETGDGDAGPGAEVVWAEVLARLEGELGYVPRAKYVPHVPLMQRKREDTYEEKIRQLAGNKKERLDRHITLSTAAAQSGATSEFFQKMRAQGSVV